MALVSNQVNDRVKYCPGRIIKLSLIASPYASARAALVNKLTFVGATTGIGRRP